MNDKAQERGRARQTRSYLMEMMQACGLRPRRQYGQNFLIDLNLLELLADSAQLGKDDVVLEVGTGTGGLTNRLCDRAGWVVSVEIDQGFHQLARKETSGRENLTLIKGDALARKNQFSPEVLGVVRDAMERLGAKCYHLTANLPYDVAASVIGNLLLDDLPIRSLTFTVQQEMAERMCAKPGVRDYGPLSILVQVLGRVEWVRSLPPDVFWPRPKIRSAILRIDVEPSRRDDLAKLRLFHRFMRDLFVHRRKNLRSGILGIPAMKPFKGQIDGILESIGVSPQARAEQMELEQLQRVFEAFQTAIAAAPAEDE